MAPGCVSPSLRFGSTCPLVGNADALSQPHCPSLRVGHRADSSSERTLLGPLLRSYRSLPSDAHWASRVHPPMPTLRFRYGADNGDRKRRRAPLGERSAGHDRSRQQDDATNLSQNHFEKHSRNHLLLRPARRGVRCICSLRDAPRSRQAGVRLLHAAAGTGAGGRVASRTGGLTPRVIS